MISICGAACVDNAPFETGDADAAARDLSKPALTDLAQPAPMDGSIAVDLARAPDLAMSCYDKGVNGDDGHHNAGQACLGCHDGTHSGAPKFGYAGTLYTSATGGSTAGAGTIIEVIDAQGHTQTVVTAQNGNFYSTLTATPPLAARASACPSDQRMTAAASSGDCNSCHDSSMRIHL